MRRGIAGTVVVAALLLPASAGAATRYVDAASGVDAPACTDPANPCKTVAYAEEAASSGDTIQIAAGVYVETVKTSKILTFVGAGAGTPTDDTGATVVRGPDGVAAEGEPAFELERGGTLRALRAQGGAGDNGGGGFDEFGGDGARFVPPGAGTYEFELIDAVVLAGDLDPGGPTLVIEPTAAVAVLGGASQSSVLIRNSALVGAGSAGTAGAQSLRVQGEGVQAQVIDSEVGAGPAPGGGSGLSIREGSDVSLLSSQVAGAGGAFVVNGSLRLERSEVLGLIAGMRVQATGAGTSTVTIIDSQVAGGGLGPFDEPTLRVATNAATATASMTARGSTFVGAGNAPVVSTEQPAGSATADLRNSIAWHFPEEVPTADLEANGGAITAGHSSFTTRVEKEGGTVTAPGSASNVVGDPQLADVANGDFSLKATSPLIDRGDPALVTAGELDLAGSPRSLDGDGDCVAAPDIGAFELTGQAAACLADEPPIVTGFSLTNKVFAPKGKRGKRGAKRRAAASAKRRSAKRRRVKRGTKFRFRLSEEARVAITIERRARGRKVRRKGRVRCVKQKRRNGRTKPRCVRWLRAGVLRAAGKAGQQSLPFSGRLRGKPLKPGRYRATIVATDDAGQTSQPRRVFFRVL